MAGGLTNWKAQGFPTLPKNNNSLPDWQTVVV
jgi:hypothetical protein